MKIHGLIKNFTPKHTLCQHIVGEQSTIVITENESEITCRQCLVRLPTKRAADVCHSCGARYVLHALYCHRCGTRRPQTNPRALPKDARAEIMKKEEE